MNDPRINTASLLPVGTLLQGGRYMVEKYLSSGNFGNTYIVTNTTFGERLAMKEFFLSGYCYRTNNALNVSLSPAVEPERINLQREKFKKEALRMRKLTGDHLVHIHDMFDENNTSYYVMDYVQGESLASYMERTGKPLTEEQTLYILNQLLGGLEEVHQKQIWHLDLKPDNIMIDRQGKVVIIDFGASKQLGASGKYTGTTGVLCYTPGFAPLEQVYQDLSKCGPWTDIYALGATLYALLTNTNPMSTASGTFAYPQPVSQKTQDLIRWMMSTEIAKRPQNIEAVRKFLSAKAMPKDKGLIGGKYRLGKLMDTTSYFNIYLAEQPSNKTALTIAEFEDHTPTGCTRYPLVREKYKEEANILKKCHNKNIVVPHDVFEANGTTYFVTKKLDGIPLSKLMEQRGKPFGEAEALGIFKELLEAMEDAHKNHIYHNLLAPENILIDKNNHVKIVNFDILHKFVMPTATANGQSEPWEDDVVFAMPCQREYLDLYLLSGETTDSPTADIYSLGASLYLMLTGENPSITAKDNIITTKVSSKTRYLVSWMMQKSTADRPQSIAEVRQYLSTSQPNKGKQQVVEKVIADKPKSKKPLKILVWAIIGAILLALILLLISKKNRLIEWEDLSLSDMETINNMIDNMVEVEAGTFIMGNTPEQNSYREDHTYNVTLTRNYKLGKYEVTRKEWLAVMRLMPEVPESWKEFYINPTWQDPITNITWEECQLFIARLNHLYPEHHFRLPTEAEWEFAARGGIYSHNYRYAGSNDKDEVAWDGYTPNEMGIKPVGQKKPNELGLYDMSGNATEWCQNDDWQLEVAIHDGAELTDPFNDSDGNYKVHRGGCYYHGTNNIADREHEDKEWGVFCLGFRLAADY